MKTKSLKEISEIMKGMDFCMLTTNVGEAGQMSRPMSNNGDGDYDGTSYFFAYENSNKVSEIKKDSKVSLQYVNLKLIGSNSFVHVSGKAELVTDQHILATHWVPSLNIWFPDGLKTKGIILIAVKANFIRTWIGSEEGEYRG